MRKYMRIAGWRRMPKPETSRVEVAKRLRAEGWQEAGGTKHDKFTKPGRPTIIVPRHRTLSPGVARSIAKAAGWL
jgi:hypothetical protein